MAIESRLIAEPLPFNRWDWNLIDIRECFKGAAIVGFIFGGIVLRGGLIGSLMLGLVSLPFAYLVGVFSESRKRFEKQRTGYADGAFKSFIGGEPKYIDTVYCFIDGGKRFAASGIALRDRTIYLMCDNTGYKIPWEDVRSWRWEVPEYQLVKIYGSGQAASSARIQAMFDNRDAIIAANSNSGMFLELKDINLPKLQFKTRDVPMLERWAEIFKQLDEGTIS